MDPGWIILIAVAGVALVGGGVWWAGPGRVRRRAAQLTKARRLFKYQRELLEARFLELAAASGKPRGLRWMECDFDDDVAYARELRSGQLAALVPPGFLRTVPAQALAEYPRYLRALVLRSERALRDPGRDQQRMLELKPFADALAGAAANDLLGDPEWQALRWDLEELRVSLFAQELGARAGVSPKRLATRLARLRGE